MSKADPNHQVPPELASSPVPSFEAIRSEPDESSELRRHQTVPIPVGLRVEVATHGLPSLPAEHLRSTDDMDDQLRPMRDVDYPLRPSRDGSAARRSRWPLMLALALVIVAAGVAFALLRTPSSPRSLQGLPELGPEPGLRPEPAPQPVSPTLDAQRDATRQVASASAIPEVASANASDAGLIEKAKAKSHKAESGKADKGAKARGPEDSDPNELMFKPE